MRINSIIFTTFLTLSNATIAEQGQELHQSQCIECHSRMTGGEGTVIYKRDDSIVNSYNQLNARVIHCATGANTGWNDSQINKVANYLNEQFYHFE